MGYCCLKNNVSVINKVERLLNIFYINMEIVPGLGQCACSYTGTKYCMKLLIESIVR